MSPRFAECSLQPGPVDKQFSSEQVQFAAEERGRLASLKAYKSGANAFFVIAGAYPPHLLSSMVQRHDRRDFS